MYVGLLYAWGSIVDPRPGNGRGKVPIPFNMRVYWLDINYLMLWSILRADLTSRNGSELKPGMVSGHGWEECGISQVIWLTFMR